MSGAIREQVFLGRDNSSRLEFLQDGNPFDSSPVTRTLMEWGNGQTLIDSDNAPDAITWQSNVLVLSLGNATLAAGTYLVRVIVFTDAYPDGLVILSEESDPCLEITIGK